MSFLDRPRTTSELFVYVRQLEAERDRYKEFVIAHTLLEKGKIDFDLHHKTVERFERASEAVEDVIREVLQEAEGDSPVNGTLL